MATTSNGERLRKGDSVVAAADLRGAPIGTEGRVSMVAGLSWIRYWVRFENGTEMGSINRSKLATPHEWERRHDEPVAVTATAEGDGDGAEVEAASGGGVEVNGAVVPQKLIDRSAAARQRLSA